jgi:hypothetical protein
MFGSFSRICSTTKGTQRCHNQRLIFFNAAEFRTQLPRASRRISRRIFFFVNSAEFRQFQPEFGFNSLKRWQGTILMNGC